LERHSL